MVRANNCEPAFSDFIHHGREKYLPPSPTASLDRLRLRIAIPGGLCGGLEKRLPRLDRGRLQGCFAHANMHLTTISHGLLLLGHVRRVCPGHQVGQIFFRPELRLLLLEFLHDRLWLSRCRWWFKCLSSFGHPHFLGGGCAYLLRAALRPLVSSK